MKEFYNSLTFDGTDYQMQSVNLRDFSEKTATPFIFMT